MAKGGKQPGAGRPKGSVTRPQLRDYYTEKERKELVALLKTKAKSDPQILKFVAEQIFGKPAQAITGPDGGALQIVFDGAFTKP